MECRHRGLKILWRQLRVGSNPTGGITSVCRGGGMADAGDLKSPVCKDVRVRVPPPAPTLCEAVAQMVEYRSPKPDMGARNSPASPGLSRGRVTQWQSRGLLSRWSGVRSPPRPFLSLASKLLCLPGRSNVLAICAEGWPSLVRLQS